MTNQKLEQLVLNRLQKPGTQPLRRTDLARELRLSDSDRTQLRRTLMALEKKGEVVCLRKNRWASAGNKQKRWTGTVRFTDQGAGYFTAEDGKRAYIARDNLKCALDEDRVSIELLDGKTSAAAGRGRKNTRSGDLLPEGRVVEVLERKNSEVVGLLRRSRYYAYVVPDNLRLGQDIRVRDWEEDLEKTPADYKVVIRLDEWTDPFKPLTGTVVEALGHRDDPNVEMQCILRAHGFRQNFPDEVVEAARGMPKKLRPADYRNRQDLRDRLTFTIDPDTARDFDDAISFEKISGSGWKLSVHIADVAHFVKKGAALDKEALHRGNSVYLVDRVVMMLPEELTTRICSLNPGVDRLAHTVEISLDGEGQVTGTKSFRSVIHSDARLNYEQAEALFNQKEGHGVPEPVAETLLLLRPVVRAVRARRIAEGSLEINTPQIKFVLNKDGKVASIHKGEAKEAYQLIEECMLLANVAVARELKEAGFCSIHRIHEEPDEDQWAQMGAELQALGIQTRPSSRGDINSIIRRAAGTPLEYTASLAVLRNLKRAGYSEDSKGHFGLAFDDYVHFTSPIRRYPDLVVHRLLAALEEKTPVPYRKEDIRAVSAQCTRTETEADAAEKESIDLRRVEYYRDLLFRGETGPYNGCIIRILNKGMVVELADTLQRGLIPFASLTDDHYEVNTTGTRAIGQRHRKTFTVGDSLSVQLIRVDTARNYIDFSLAENGKPASSAVRKAKGKKPGTGRKKSGVTLTGEKPRGAKPKKRRRLK